MQVVCLPSACVCACFLASHLYVKPALYQVHWEGSFCRLAVAENVVLSDSADSDPNPGSKKWCSAEAATLVQRHKQVGEERQVGPQNALVRAGELVVVGTGGVL